MSISNRPRTFAEAMEIKKAAGSFDQLMLAAEVRDWLPAALDALAATILGALQASDPELTAAIRAKAVINDVDAFAAEVKERIAGAIGKRHVAKTARNGGSLAEAIL